MVHVNDMRYNSNNMYKPSADFQINFLNNIQWLLESSSYTSTYKFALLMSLSNLSIESGIDDNRICSISYLQLAEQFIHLYWTHALPFSKQKPNSVLRQSHTTGQIKVINCILDLQAEAKTINLNTAHAFNKQKWDSTLKDIARTIKTYPAKHLQSAKNNTQREFLYHYNAKSKEIVLNAGIAYCLAKFSKIIHKLCQQYWSEFVRKNRHNQEYFNEDLDLYYFLFNQSRQSLNALVPLLTDIQKGQCFYCHNSIKGTPEVDHFIPWSKYPIDTLHNFVLADHKCNNSKRDFLAEERFYDSWLIRNDDYGKLIGSEGKSLGFISNIQRSETISQWAYQVAIEHSDLVWSPGTGNRLRTIDPRLLRHLRG